jgi:hypothetical protein
MTYLGSARLVATAIAPSIIAGLFVVGVAVLTWFGASWQAKVTYKRSLQLDAQRHTREIAAEERRRKLQNFQEALTDFINAGELARQTAVNLAYGTAQQPEARTVLTKLVATRPRVFTSAPQDMVLAAQKYVDDISTLLRIAETKPLDHKAMDDAQNAVAASFTEAENIIRRELGLDELATQGGVIILTSPHEGLRVDRPRRERKQTPSALRQLGLDVWRDSRRDVRRYLDGRAGRNDHQRVEDDR